MTTSFVSPDTIRDQFSQAMSEMYRTEVPQYGDLLTLVADINQATLATDPALQATLAQVDELHRLDVERHGAIRLGTAAELATMRRVFALMGMAPVGYYDLSVAGVPVHATAFRPVTDAALRINPFRVFTSLLRLELLADPALRAQAEAILARRDIFTPQARALLDTGEQQGGLSAAQAAQFVAEITQTFRWHSDATVDPATYDQLLRAHRLVADVVCFKGPHINHLTPRTLDIDAAQAAMPRHGITAKDVIEGPPRRRHAILLRQTSFKALQEPIRFAGAGDIGTHTARFGEIEQRGLALTQEGRALYDTLLAQVRSMGNAGSTADDYESRLAQAFAAFPDDLDTLHDQKLGFFRYTVRDATAFANAAQAGQAWDLTALRASGAVQIVPIVYEDFLPVSAAGIFQSNLGGDEQKHYDANAAKDAFEAALEGRVLDEIALYTEAQATSLEQLQAAYAAQQATAS